MYRIRVQHIQRSISYRTKATEATKIHLTKTSESSENQLMAQPPNMPFSRAKIGPFFQEQPKLGNQFLEDSTLYKFLKRTIPSKEFQEINPDLERFGNRVATDIHALHMECHNNEPYLKQYHAWGKRQDKIFTCEAWKKMKEISADEGLVAIAYERKYAEFSRLYQVAKLYLFSPSSGLYSCPLAMTDGAARSIEVVNDDKLLATAYKNLTSRDPSQFWTSGQWMTERKGGSDVALGTETLAVPQTDGTYRLYGYKWFSSATDADMTLTLARIVDPDGQVQPGTRGLSMFYARVWNDDGTLNNIEVQRLKDKLGTRQLPTAELLLDGVVAERVSEEGRGVATIATMLTLTRLHNTISSASAMRRIVNLARDYSTKRECFGKIIKDHKLHIKNLANMEIETRAATLFSLEMGRLLGLEEVGKANKTEMELMRLLTPVAKLYTAKQAVAVSSEGLECFGGMGYLEDTGLPLILRDAQVLPIWEGTTNILSLDVLRAIAKTKGSALNAFHKTVTGRLSNTSIQNNQDLKSCVGILTNSVNQLVQFAATNTQDLELAGRDFAYGIARIFMGTLMVEQASFSDSTPTEALAAKRWCQKDMLPFKNSLAAGDYKSDVTDTEFSLVFEGYNPTGNSKL